MTLLTKRLFFYCTLYHQTLINKAYVSDLHDALLQPGVQSDQRPQRGLGVHGLHLGVRPHHVHQPQLAAADHRGQEAGSGLATRGLSGPSSVCGGGETPPRDVEMSLYIVQLPENAMTANYLKEASQHEYG